LVHFGVFAMSHGLPWGYAALFFTVGCRQIIPMSGWGFRKGSDIWQISL
jgi:hypothetical protein